MLNQIVMDPLGAIEIEPIFVTEHARVGPSSSIGVSLEWGGGISAHERLMHFFKLVFGELRIEYPSPDSLRMQERIRHALEAKKSSNDDYIAHMFRIYSLKQELLILLFNKLLNGFGFFLAHLWLQLF